MQTVKLVNSSAKTIAHRGLSGIEKENTNSAFVAAGNRSYFGIETDIHRTGDGNFILCHDNDLKRIAGLDIEVEKVTLAELRNVIIYDRDQSNMRNDLRLSELENYISICKKYEKHCILELKSNFTDEEILKIIEIIREYNYLESVTFISFVYENLLKVRKFLPEHSVQFLFTEFKDEIVNKVIADKIDIDVYYKALDEKIIKTLHQNGIKINCWTVDDKQEAEKLINWGIDFITTNILE